MAAPALNESSLARRVGLEEVDAAGEGRPDLVLMIAATMNGWKLPILMEELGERYDYVFIDFASGMQKSPEFKRFNPNGRIPALYDRSNGLRLAESGALLEYVAEKYHSRRPAVYPSEVHQRWSIKQWVYWQVSGLGPAMGQAMYMQRLALPQGLDVSQFVVQRFLAESQRCLLVIAEQVAASGGPFLFGSEPTIADIAAYPYARSHFWANLDVGGEELSPLRAWLDACDARPSFREGLRIPHERREFFGEGDWQAMISTNARGFQLSADGKQSGADESRKES